MPSRASVPGKLCRGSIASRQENFNGASGCASWAARTWPAWRSAMRSFHLPGSRQIADREQDLAAGHRPVFQQLPHVPGQHLSVDRAPHLAFGLFALEDFVLHLKVMDCRAKLLFLGGRLAVASAAARRFRAATCSRSASIETSFCWAVCSSPSTCLNSRSNCGRRSTARSSPARTCCPCSTRRSLTVPSAAAKTSRRRTGCRSPSATTVKSVFTSSAAATTAATRPAASAAFTQGPTSANRPRPRRTDAKGTLFKLQAVPQRGLDVNARFGGQRPLALVKSAEELLHY